MHLIDRFRSAGARLVLGVGLVPLVLAACAAPPGGANGEPATLSGTVTYLPRIALPPDAVVHVWLEDFARPDSAGTEVATQAVETDGRQVPIPFALTYDPAQIQPGHSYGVRAEIRDGAGDVLWTTEAPRVVLAEGAPTDSIEIRVIQATAPANPDEMSALVGTEWTLVRIERAASAGLTPEAGEPYSIVFDADGRYSGQADCNRYAGEFEAQLDGRITLKRGLATLAACAPPSASDAFFDVLNAVSRYTVAGNELRLETDGGGALVFQRAGAAGDPGEE